MAIYYEIPTVSYRYNPSCAANYGPLANAGLEKITIGVVARIPVWIDPGWYVGNGPISISAVPVSGTMCYIRGRGFFGERFTTSSTFDIKKWIILHLTRDATTLKTTFYVNGTLVTGVSAPQAASFSGNYPDLSLSAVQTNAGGFLINPCAVQFAAVDIYNTVLSPENVAREADRYRKEWQLLGL
jgi:hypothetical protein